MLSVTTNIVNSVFFKHRDGSQLNMRIERFCYRTNEVELSFDGDTNNDFQVMSKEQLLASGSKVCETERIIFGGIRRKWSDGNVYSSWTLSNGQILTVMRRRNSHCRLILIDCVTRFKIETTGATLKVAFREMRKRIRNMRSLIEGLR